MRRLRVWLVRLLPVAGLAALVFFGQRWWVHAEGTGRLNALRAKLDRDDPGWRLQDREAARVQALPPDDQNVLKLGLKAKAAIPPAFEEFQKAYDAVNGWLNDEEINRLPQPEALAEARRTRTKCRAAIDLALAASAYPTGGTALTIAPNPLNTLLPHAQDFRAVASLLHLNGGVLAADNDPAGALASCLAELRLARGFGDEPTLIAVLIRVAIASNAARSAEQLLAYGEPKDGLAELQEAFAREAEANYHEPGLKGERAMQDALYDWLEQDPGHVYELAKHPDARSIRTGAVGWLFRVRIPDEHVAALEHSNATLDVLKLPSEQWPSRVEALPPVDAADHPIASNLLPAYGRILEFRLRAMALHRATAAAIACERFRRANGRWPKDLAEIPPTILKAIPNDPYTGRPVVYRPVADGVKVYSVARDGVDNEGNLTARSVAAGQDFGVRLWSPDHRRAAPPKVEPPAGPDM